MRISRTFGTAAAILILSVGASSAGDERLHELFAAYWKHEAERDPLGASYRGDHRFSDRLPDFAPEARAAHRVALEGFLRRVREIDHAELDGDDVLSAELFERLMVQDLEALRFDPHVLPVNQLWGPHLGFAQVPDYHPFDTAQHARDFVTRLSAFPRMIDQLIANMREGMESGIVRYRGTVEKAIPQVRALAAGPARDHSLASAVGKLSGEIDAAEREEIAAAILGGIEERVLPAYAKLARFLEEEYLPACRAEPGVLALPDGEERYAFLVRRYTTTDRTPAGIHEIGLHETARIRGEMNAIREQVGFEGSLEEFFEHLRTDRRFYYTSKEEYLEDYRKILRAMDAKLPALFGFVPDAPYELKEIETWREKAAPTAYYYSAPDDGSRPGYFYVNTYDLKSRPRYSMEALAYHEAVPGHHLQYAVQQRLDLPEFRRHRGFTAYVEGWGLYSERIPLEVGAYSDPYSDFGRLVFEAWRASRLVVDTGIHAMGWSREQAIAYCEDNTALARHDIESEVGRYIAVPGQALAYKIGEIRIRKLRAAAEKRLGDRFDVRAFHDVILGSGPLPLDLLERVVERWVKETEDR